MINPTEYKGYNIEGDGTYGYKHIKAIGKGSVPKELRGIYTNASFARSAIDTLELVKAAEQAEAPKKVVKKAS